MTNVSAGPAEILVETATRTRFERETEDSKLLFFGDIRVCSAHHTVWENYSYEYRAGPDHPMSTCATPGRNRVTDTLIGLTCKAPVVSLPRKKDESDIAPSKARMHDVATVEILFNRCRLEYMAEFQVRSE